MPALYSSPSMSKSVANYAYDVRKKIEKRIKEVLQGTEYHYLGVSKKALDASRCWVYGPKGAESVNSDSEGVKKELYELYREWLGTNAGENYLDLTVFRELEGFWAKGNSYNFFVERGYNVCECGERAIFWMTTYLKSSEIMPYTRFCVKHAYEFYHANKPVRKPPTPEQKAEFQRKLKLREIDMLVKKRKEINKRLRQLRKAE